jgi:hypothetical protein
LSINDINLKRMQGHPKIAHENRRARIYLKCPSEMMLSKLKLFLAKIHHPKAIPSIVVPFIYLQCTSVEFDTILIILQCRIPTVSRNGVHLEILNDYLEREFSGCSFRFAYKIWSMKIETYRIFMRATTYS